MERWSWGVAPITTKRFMGLLLFYEGSGRGVMLTPPHTQTHSHTNTHTHRGGESIPHSCSSVTELVITVEMQRVKGQRSQYLQHQVRHPSEKEDAFSFDGRSNTKNILSSKCPLKEDFVLVSAL
ncbi:hypothetical protein NL108_011956 [Boleophthalmus pectinirostris]|nr:hypothetical protein NL108_011956 [Boleophthalmus pectinirostris]